VTGTPGSTHPWRPGNSPEPAEPHGTQHRLPAAGAGRRRILLITVGSPVLRDRKRAIDHRSRVGPAPIDESALTPTSTAGTIIGLVHRVSRDAGAPKAPGGYPSMTGIIPNRRSIERRVDDRRPRSIVASTGLPTAAQKPTRLGGTRDSVSPPYFSGWGLARRTASVLPKRSKSSDRWRSATQHIPVPCKFLPAFTDARDERISRRVRHGVAHTCDSGARSIASSRQRVASGEACLPDTPESEIQPATSSLSLDETSVYGAAGVRIITYRDREDHGKKGGEGDERPEWCIAAP